MYKARPLLKQFEFLKIGENFSCSRRVFLKPLLEYTGQRSESDFVNPWTVLHLLFLYFTKLNRRGGQFTAKIVRNSYDRVI